jgi:acyl transferase domain-containing protein
MTFISLRQGEVDMQIAVIGMGCCYPGSENLEKLWENILARRQQFRKMPEQRLPLEHYHSADRSAPDKTYGQKAALIEGYRFDWAKHCIPKTVFETTDIAHWIALDTALAAVADAGYTRKNIPGEKTGVIVGNTLTGEITRANLLRLRWPYVHKSLQVAADRVGMPAEDLHALAANMEEYYKAPFPAITEDSLAGGLSNTIAGRICNYLDLNGGGYTVDGACSSSLLAIATSMTHLANHEIDLGIAGGVDISLDPFELVGFAKAKALSAAGMNVYDRNAQGFIPGEGAGFVVLKRLEDAVRDGDYVYAVAHGWGVSSDGKGGLMAPSARGQSFAIQRAYQKSSYGIDTVDFIEGHGTGTKVGDAVELRGISLALGEREGAGLRPCGVTSVKSIIGHTKAASGIAGFIKAVLAVNQRIVPPTAGCHEPNSVFEDEARHLYPVLKGRSGPRMTPCGRGLPVPVSAASIAILPSRRGTARATGCKPPCRRRPCWLPTRAASCSCSMRRDPRNCGKKSQRSGQERKVSAMESCPTWPMPSVRWWPTTPGGPVSSPVLPTNCNPGPMHCWKSWPATDRIARHFWRMPPGMCWPENPPRHRGSDSSSRGRVRRC